MPNVKADLVWLATAVEACRGRIEPEAISQAQTVVNRVDQRLAVAPDITVVAIAGATGSGKSSVFNALTRTVLAEPGLQRPMTQQAMAVTFGSEDTSQLLDWLGIQRRHVTSGEGMDGVVLLDLADYDSIEVTHREEVDRLIEMVDQFLWIVDPQKYADAALHERYLRQMSGHSDVMTFVLNQIDRLTSEQTIQVHHDLERLLTDDGLASPVIYEVSALSGAGIDDLRRHVTQIAASKRATAARLRADIVKQATTLRGLIGSAPVGGINPARLADLTNACVNAAGVDRIGDAVEQSVRRRGHMATGWPVLSWISRLKAEPLKRFHLDQLWSRKPGGDPASLTRTSIPHQPVARAGIDLAVRSMLVDVDTSLPRLWRSAVARVVKQQMDQLPDQIDQAVVTTDLGLDEGHGWWKAIRAVQWVILAVTVIGLGWLTANFVMNAYLGLGTLPTPTVGRLGLPTLMVIAGVVLGLATAGLSRLAVRAGARLSAVSATHRLRRSLEQTAQATLVEPVNAELRRHDEAWHALEGILG
ncbi:MAG: 50S ribosome-binding GTPase [Propionibacteriaceae bacterium]|jgi:putative protein kinase ArgK-like GTPase of G3E family|nr:50S ribosome-binding GTPase [Propionibacteriaceae bacterium]